MSTYNIGTERQFTKYAILLTPLIKQQMLNWANRFSICCLMDNNEYKAGLHSYECLVAVGAWKWVKVPAGNAFPSLKAFNTNSKDWLFGHFGFDLKAETEGISSELPDRIGFPDCYFFVPEHLLLLDDGIISISSYSADPSAILEQILSDELPVSQAASPVSLQAAMDRNTYLEKVESLRAHILKGDCYEINFCQEFFAPGAIIDPVTIFQTLSALSPTPFSVFYKLEDHYLLCASPERFLRIESGIVRSQPIKGTARRHLDDAIADAISAQDLVASEKERSENVMVVDLVRNDLSRFCKPGTVEVEELFGVYSFPQVHQMISTVKGDIVEGLSWIDAVQQSFPMGSMTGAPKHRVLELIESYELTRRGIFSGAVGYCTPGGDADFNVVIRSILYNSSTNYLSCLVGSAITWNSEGGKEYDECQLKIMAIQKALGG
jgi:para-aminobenzoate synthetase component 1